MNDVFVSVILPNYNHYEFLPKRWESIINQTYDKLEIILLDDASTDASVSLLETYAKHPKVTHTLFNKSNSGSPFVQWERGLSLASGNFIWIAESDDYNDPDFLKTLVSTIDSRTVLAYSGSVNVDHLGSVIGLNENPDPLDRKRWYSDFKNDGNAEIRRYLRFKNTIPNASAVLFKKEMVALDFLKHRYKYCGDWYFWMQLLKRGDIAYSAQRLNFFRFHDDSSRAVKNLEKDVAMFEEFFDLIFEESGPGERLLFRKRYDWIPEALEQFELEHGKDKIFDKLPKKYQKLLGKWKRMATIF